MNRRYLPVKACALVAAGFLLTGGNGVAFAAPDSPSHSGGGKPSPAASGASPGAPNSGPKTLPNIASRVAGAAIGKANPASTGTPTSFGKSVAAAASSLHGIGQRGISQIGDIATRSGIAVPTAIPSATVTVTVDPTATSVNATAIVTLPVGPTAAIAVPLNVTAVHTPSASTRGSHSASAPSRADRTGAVPAVTAPRTEPSATLAPGPAPRQSAAAPSPATAPAAAALSGPPQSTGSPAPASGPAYAAGSWLAHAADHVVSVVREALREVTLKDLALAAMPGVAAILFFFLTGIGIGHRQARFGFALEPTGALRFAVRGPLGVVRPGGFISVPTRAGATRNASPRRRSDAVLSRAA